MSEAPFNESKSDHFRFGNQVWMKKNLDVDHFRNGEPINYIGENNWHYVSEPAWCFYNNDPKNGDIYGKLYNWYAVNDPRGLSPEGWHVPSDEEWAELRIYLLTNNGDFLALPGGARFVSQYTENHQDDRMGTAIDWWSSTEYYPSSLNAMSYATGAYSNFKDLSKDNFQKKCGFYVRLIKDK